MQWNEHHNDESNPVGILYRATIKLQACKKTLANKSPSYYIISKQCSVCDSAQNISHNQV